MQTFKEFYSKYQSHINNYSFLFFLFLVSFLFTIIYINRDINLLDEGTNIIMILRSKSELVYKDFDLFVLPGYHFLHNFIFNLTGYSLLKLRLITAISNALAVVLIFLISKKVSKNNYFSILVWWLSLVFGISLHQILSHYSWFAMFFGMISMYFIFIYLDKKSLKWILLAGLMLGFAALTKQSMAVYFMLGFILFAIILKLKKKDEYFDLKSVSMFILGGSIIVLPFLVYILSNGLLEDMLKQTLYYPLTIYQDAKLPPPALNSLELLIKNPSLGSLFPYLFYFQVIIIIAAGVYFVFKHKLQNKNDYYSLLLGLITITTFLLNLERASFYKTRTTIGLSFCLMFYLIYKFLEYKKLKSQIIVYSLIIVSTVISLTTLYLKDVYFQTRNTLMPGTTNIYVDSSTAQKYTVVFDAMQKYIPSNEKVFIYPDNPMTYYLTGRSNPTKVSLLINGHFTEEILAQIIVNLQNNNVQYVLFDEAFFVDGEKFENEGKLLNDYILREYHSIWELNSSTKILKRN